MHTYAAAVIADQATGHPLAGIRVTVEDAETGVPVQPYRDGAPVQLVTGTYGLITEWQTEDTTRRVALTAGSVRLTQWCEELQGTAADAVSLMDDRLAGAASAANQAATIRDGLETRVRAVEKAVKTDPGSVTDGQVASALAQPDNLAADVVRSTQVRREQTATMWRGVCVRTWQTGYLDSGEARTETQRVLDATGGDAIILCVNVYQRTFTDSGGFIQRTPIAEVERYIKWAHGRGYRVMLKPHVETYDNPGVWRANISPADPAAWFAEYGVLLAEYASLAERARVDAVCVGSELTVLATGYPERWRDLIRATRAQYGGLLTYGASFNASGDEGAQVEFWDDLDVIGLDLYVRVPSATASPEELAGAIELDVQNGALMGTIDALARRYGKPIMLAEYGVPMGSDGKHVTGYTMDWYASFVRAMWREFLGRDWFIGGGVWAIDPLGMQAKEYAPGSPVLAAMRDAHALLPSYARPPVGVTLANTWRTGSTDRWMRIATVTVPRTWAGVSARFEISADAATSLTPDHAVVEVRIGRGAGATLDAVRVRQVGHSTMAAERVGYTTSGSTLTLWAQARAGQAFQTTLERATTPAWVDLVHQGTGAQEAAPAGLTTAPTRATLTTTSSAPELQSGTRTIPWTASGSVPWWRLNGHLTVSLDPGPAGLVVSRVFKFEQDSVGYRTLTLNGVNTPGGPVRLARSPGAVTWVEFYWDGTSWHAWVLRDRLGPETFDLGASIPARSGSTIKVVRSGAMVQVTFDIINTENVPAYESTLFYMGDHAPVHPVRGTFSTLDAPVAGWVRTDGTQVKITPTSTIAPDRRVQGTLNWITTA